MQTAIGQRHTTALQAFGNVYTLRPGFPVSHCTPHRGILARGPGFCGPNSPHRTPSIRQYVPRYTRAARAAAAPPVGALRRRCRQPSSYSAALAYIQTPTRSIAKTKNSTSVIRVLLHSPAGGLVWVAHIVCNFIHYIDIIQKEQNERDV